MSVAELGRLLFKFRLRHIHFEYCWVWVCNVGMPSMYGSSRLTFTEKSR